jgi:short-subunit dehydrogenase
MAECCKIELDRWGVKVQVVTPGFVETPAQDNNAFPKPDMVSPETAAEEIVAGLKGKRFEITFPKSFIRKLKIAYALPKDIYLPLVQKQTGWAKPLAKDAKPGG